MFKILYYILFFALAVACRKSEDLQSDFYHCNIGFTDSSEVHPNNIHYQTLINEITSSGIVGITMAVYEPNKGIWMGASGKSDLHNDIDMEVCNLIRVGSTVKMVTAVTVLKLIEEGKLNLDDKISSYLQGDVIEKIENAEVVTIRQLLQHTSGIYNYIQNLAFQTRSLF